MDYRDADTIERERRTTTQGYISRHGTGSINHFTRPATIKPEVKETGAEVLTRKMAWIRKQPGFYRIADHPELIQEQLRLIP